jgi:hypothetical protein
MAKDKADALSLKTERGTIFTRRSAEKGRHETWELTAHGTTMQVYATFVSEERANALEGMYREDRGNHDIRSEEYLESLKRLIKVGRDQLFSGDAGVVLQLARSSGEYHLAFHKVRSDARDSDTFDPDQFAADLAQKDVGRRTGEARLPPIEGSEGKGIPKQQAPEAGAVSPNKKPLNKKSE